MAPPSYNVEGPALAGYENTNRVLVDGIAKKIEEDVINKVEGILAERGGRYGPFPQHARFCQGLKLSIESMLIEKNKHLAPDMKQALDVICDKIARIINGDENYVDNWDDIAGYATLVSKRLTSNGN